MAEAAVAGRLCGERERALKIIKRALRLLDGRRGRPAARRLVLDPALPPGARPSARGDGWDELATAQELVRGLPPSEVHAEVLANVASWGMLHGPGPETLAAAERAVEYARLRRRRGHRD